jgi:hypothetical protein
MSNKDFHSSSHTYNDGAAHAAYNSREDTTQPPRTAADSSKLTAEYGSRRTGHGTQSPSHPPSRYDEPVYLEDARYHPEPRGEFYTESNNHRSNPSEAEHSLRGYTELPYPYSQSQDVYTRHRPEDRDDRRLDYDADGRPRRYDDEYYGQYNQPGYNRNYSGYQYDYDYDYQSNYDRPGRQDRDMEYYNEGYERRYPERTERPRSPYKRSEYDEDMQSEG